MVTVLRITMANSKTPLSAFFTFLFSSLVTAGYYESISPTYLGFKEEKFTHLHFYFHDTVAGPKPSIVISIESPLKGKSNSPLPFGSVVVLEDPLTVAPEHDSKVVGKAQGFYISVSHEAVFELEMLMGMTFAFNEGEYNGSTLSMLGRNTISSPIREIPIIGGTGAFRFARGFVKDRILRMDHHTGDAVVEFNVYVFHYSSAPCGLTKLNFNTGVEFMTDPMLHKIYQ